jgi:hypothetical protein
MARRKKNNQNRILFGFLIVVGLVVIAIPVLDFEFDVLPLTLLQNIANCNPNQVDCGFRLNNFRDSDVGSSDFPTEQTLPLFPVDRNAPISFNFAVSPSFVPAFCQPQVTEDISIIVRDETGLFIALVPEGQTDIQPLLTGQNALVFDWAGVGVCTNVNATGPIRYQVSCAVGDDVFCASLNFKQKPIEITEFGNTLLAQNERLNDFRARGVTEISRSFAIAEQFQVTQPTVITKITARMGSDLSSREQDDQTRVTAFVWNSDKVPPERIVQSAETFIGSIPQTDLTFTFPNAVVLLPTQNNQPINYAVGYKVTQNPGQQFVYTFSDQTANTHRCVIDKSPNPLSETAFASITSITPVDSNLTPKSVNNNGLCGMDIFHSQFQAFSILNVITGPLQTGGGNGGGGTTIITQTEIIEKITNIENTILTLGSGEQDQITKTELIAILCEGIEPRPQVCEEGTGLFLNANQCGVTEIFFEGDCLCQPGFDRTEQGTCELRDGGPSILQVGQFTSDDIIIIVLGLLIIVVGAVGIAFVKGRRR